MKSNRIDANLRCPSCNGLLSPRVLVCDSCGLKVEGDFVQNEFGSLAPDELHFLRVFIYCEGRIRDMEAALGVSYPTVKAHLASIKEKLGRANPRFAEGQGPRGGAAREGEASTEEVLDKLENGRIAYKEALRLLRAAARKRREDNDEPESDGKDSADAGERDDNGGTGGGAPESPVGGTAG